MASAGPTNRINETALHWAVEVAHGAMTQDDRAELEAWLDADTRHRGAFLRARAWMRATEDAVVDAHSGADRPASLPSVPVTELPIAALPVGTRSMRFRGRPFPWGKRTAAGAGIALTCAIAVIATGVTPLSLFQPQQVVTQNRLRDGSTVRFGKDAKIEVALSADYRRITLLSGEATFTVAKDKARPFVVRSGGVYAQATGTVYSVRRVGASGGTVTVTEGSVLVWARDERDEAILLHAGETVTLNPGPIAPATPRPAASAELRLPPPALAQISLDNVTIEAAARRFNRVNSTKIVVADPRIADTTITGLYKANDPEQFARAAAVVANGRVEIEPKRIVILMK